MDPGPRSIAHTKETAISDSPTTNCPLCDRQGPLRALYPHLGIVKCDSCGLVFFPPQGVQTAQLYTEEYFTGAEYRDYLADEKALRKNFRQRLADVRRLKAGGRLMEIGCAYGLFLDEARAHYDVSGVDIAREALDYARDRLKLPVRYADFLSLEDEPSSRDVICMWDTLEHLSRPVEYIEKAARWLKPGGYLVMTTGDVGSRVARIRKDKWRLIHPPTHLFYFSCDTMRRAAQRAGLVEHSHRSVSYHRSYKSIAFGLFMAKAKKHPLLYRLCTVGGRLDFNIGLNLGDVVMYVARKPCDSNDQ